MSTFRTYLQLVRLPAVFTAMADIFLGYLLTHATLHPLSNFGLLLLASSCLYLSGMVFNALGRAPRRHDQVVLDGFQMDVLEVSGTRIVRVRVSRREEAPTEADD